MIYASRWLLPIDRRPIEGGWIEVLDGRITRLGEGRPPAHARELGDVAILPGLVNAHTHLELSWMAGLVPPAESFVEWVTRLLDRRRQGGPASSDLVESIFDGIRAAQAAGTVLVGDVANGLLTPGLMAQAGMSGVVFHEVLGFNAIDPATIVAEARAALARALTDAERVAVGRTVVRGRVAAHATYSVAPALIRQIARGGADDDVPLSVHLSESVEELEFLTSGSGPMRQLLERLGVWTDRWTPPGVGPAAYLDRLGYLRGGTLVVHGVHLDESELELLVRRHAVLVVCPRSNVWVGSGLPRLSHYIAAGLRVAVGTDSLASAPSLNVFDELAELRRIAPDVAASTLLESATRVGAEALGFGDTFGTLAPGRSGQVIGVDVPADVTDVEEYLVGGVPASAVHRMT
jgi:cytosine/adenosine deaminase-related metal-dependent hydrolase